LVDCSDPFYKDKSAAQLNPTNGQLVVPSDPF